MHAGIKDVNVWELLGNGLIVAISDDATLRSIEPAYSLSTRADVMAQFRVALAYTIITIAPQVIAIWFEPRKGFRRKRPASAAQPLALRPRSLETGQHAFSNALTLELRDRAEDVHLELPRRRRCPRRG